MKVFVIGNILIYPYSIISFSKFYFRFHVHLPDGTFQVHSITGGFNNVWTHFVLNFDVKQQEIRLYQDGAYIDSEDTKSDENFGISGDGRIVIGKNYTVGRGGTCLS